MPGFEEKMRRLEAIVGSLEKGECGLDDALSLYEEGVRLSRELASALDSARQKVASINEEDAGGAASDGPTDPGTPGKTTSSGTADSRAAGAPAPAGAARSAGSPDTAGVAKPGRSARSAKSAKTAVAHADGE